MGRRSIFAAVGMFIAIVATCAGAELASRVYWRLTHDLPMGQPDRILYAFYPPITRVEAELRKALTGAGRDNVRIYNLGVPAHTSRDSLLKYEAIQRARFDLVILYDGINDVRANAVPPQLFRDNYDHFEWYETINDLAPYHGNAVVALPLTLRFLVHAVRRGFMRARYIPMDDTRPDWRVYGHQTRSVASFAQNERAILDRAAERGDPVMLMTFATSIAKSDEIAAMAPWTGRRRRSDRDLGRSR